MPQPQERRELEDDLTAVAAPVRDHLGRVVAAATIAGPVSRMPKRTLIDLSVAVLETAATISHTLGHQEPNNAA